MAEKKEKIEDLKNNYIDTTHAAKSSPVAFLLCTFLGILGAHRFYTGYYFIAIFQLLTCGGFVVWFLIDIYMLFSNKFEDSKGNPLANYNNKMASGLVCLAVILAICWGLLYINQIDTVIKKITNNEIETPFDNLKKKKASDILKKYEGTTSEKKTENIDYSFVSKSGVNILEDSPCYNSQGKSTICGVVVNSADKDARNILVKIELYDKNKKFISFSEAKIYSLKSGEKLEFQAPIYYDTVASYKISKIVVD
ncbi:MAG: TM2 domain-containing protein [Candidatus Gastranaerophilales bacterium]|nr:TM2 domain-containing protein [Candidatus Gastranaerophilales bacterium]